MQGEFSAYQSPLSFRYASPEMRELFGEAAKYRLWRRVWVALATVECRAGLVSQAELDDLIKHQDDVDIARIFEIEKDTKHDVVAAIREFAEKAKVGGGKIHLGATSMDVTDNADALRMQQALARIEVALRQLLKIVARQAEAYADVPCLGYTHLQPAEPTTIGYRLAFYGADLLADYQALRAVQQRLVGKGMKGAIGTRASYTSILADVKMTAEELDVAVMDELGLKPALITTQVVSRKQDYSVLSVLAGISASLAKFAADVRLLQSPGFGEWAEPFGAKQVGSSAMPFKKNPVTSEKICSLGRQVAQLPGIALENASLSYLERTLDDSANRRMIIPEGFLLTDEMLISAIKVLDGLWINEKRVKANLHNFSPFAATEVLIIEAVKAGADRQDMHELMRELALKAWPEDQPGQAMEQLLVGNKALAKYVPAARLKELLDVRRHLGDAPERTKTLAGLIKKELQPS